MTDLRTCSLNKKGNGTPMKTLIAQEMYKEVESKHNQPNVVAKLMGLDALPLQQPISSTQRSPLKSYSRRSLSHSGIVMECWEEDQSFLDKRMQCEGHQCHKQNELKNVYEIWKQSQKASIRDHSAQKGMYNENIDEKKMALIRQKFMEAKCLATGSGCQSKEFIDAVEVLSSNRDLLLKFLDEPNSMFSHRLYHKESVSPPPETKHITVLRPSKLVDGEKCSERRKDKQTKKPAQMRLATGYDKSNTGFSPTYSIQRVDENPSQPTRIVVLKPSPGKIHNIKAVVSPPSSSPRILHGEDIYDEHEDDKACESREVAEEITCQMHENVVGHRRDETLLSSVFSNGYIGDDSSFNRSENGYAKGNLSDSEVTSPISRHSWDYVNKFGSPYSSSSFSRASCSPESSVCREAKKRLSERWAMMTLNESHQEQKGTRRSSSTLGEMLALSDVKRPVKYEEEGTNKQRGQKDSTSNLISKMNKEEGVVVSPKSLLRPKSLPVSSTEYSATLNTEVSDPEISKTEVPKELTKAKSTKSSLKGRVSSLFFSGSKRSSKEKSVTSQFQDESQSSALATQGSPVPFPDKSGQDATQCINNGSFEECSSPGLPGSPIKTMHRDFLNVPKNQGSQERGLSAASLVMPGSISENHDHPSPISVLERLFEDSTIPEPSCNMKLDHRGKFSL
uniref:Uncharacterized protein MANES_12G040100 n=1 Tax=Rhizophora mucronata TaxID=61149 RepID=A0A2P2KXP9_RHIMU